MQRNDVVNSSTQVGFLTHKSVIFCYRSIILPACNLCFFHASSLFERLFHEWSKSCLKKTQKGGFWWQHPVSLGLYYSPPPPKRTLPFQKCYSLSVTDELRCQQHTVDFLLRGLWISRLATRWPSSVYTERSTPVVFSIVILSLRACAPPAPLPHHWLISRPRVPQVNGL